MSLYQHILLAVDLAETGSEPAEKALAIARTSDARLSLIHVIEPTPSYGTPGGLIDVLGAIKERAMAEVDKFCEDTHMPEGGVRRVEIGSVKSQILWTAKELEVDLIVLGSHSRYGLARLLGSTASAVLHGAPCDVLTVRCSERKM